MISFQNKSIILFDGVCNLCNSSIQFIIKRDKKKYFLFSSLQSDAGQSILLHYNLENLDFNSIILIQNNKIYDKSTAILKIARQLSGGYKLVYIFIIIPRFIRDFIYKIVSKNRYKWFGKRNECMLPSSEHKMRFLE